MDFSPVAMDALNKRYLKKGEQPKDLFRRVAKAIASIEEDTKYEELFYNMMIEKKFFPNSPCLMNAGTDIGQMMACFVLPVDDSMEGIFKSIRDTAVIHKSGGGTGFNFSKLRPKDTQVNSTGGQASGPISFMRVFNEATDVVKQGGKRRGANMGIMNVDHPDILEFIDCKKDKTKMTNFNLSVGISDKFMKAVKNDEEWALNGHKIYATPDANGDYLKYNTIKAKELWDKIIYNAWESGEPGIIFLDKVNKHNILEQEIEATNPCGN